MNRDQLNTQGDHLSLIMGTAPLDPGTQPLGFGAGTRPLKETALLRMSLESTLSKAGKLASSLENRVELLFRACEESALAVPGVDSMAYRHPVSPQGRKIIAYLEKVLQLKPDLAKKIQIAIFRYQEATEVLTLARASLRANEIDDDLLEQVKLKFFYLTNYHEEFKTDPLLTQMFPPPPPGTTDTLGRQGSAPLMPDAIKKYRQMREQTAHRAEALVRHLQPGMDRVAHVLTTLQDVKGKSLLDIFNPTQRQEKLLAQRLKEDPRASQMLRNAHALFLQMQEQTREVRKGAQYEPLLEVIEYMGQLIGVWSQHALLKEFFPDLNRALFATKPGGTSRLTP